MIMDAFVAYFLKTAVTLTVFYLFYRFFLRKETFFRFNRYYFLGSIVISLLIPLSAGGYCSADHACFGSGDARPVGLDQGDLPCRSCFFPVTAFVAGGDIDNTYPKGGGQRD